MPAACHASRPSVKTTSRSAQSTCRRPVSHSRRGPFQRNRRRSTVPRRSKRTPSRSRRSRWTAASRPLRWLHRPAALITRCRGRRDERRTERGERRPDGTCATRLAEDRGDLPVGHDLAPRDATDEPVDQPAGTAGSSGRASHRASRQTRSNRTGPPSATRRYTSGVDISSQRGKPKRASSVCRTRPMS